MNKTRLALVVIAGVVVLALGIGGVSFWVRTTEGPRSVAYHPVVQPITQTLLLTGRLAPPVRTALGAMSQGTVTGVLVDEGDRVEAGTLLVQLADDDASARVRQAEARVREAEARLGKVRGVGRRVANERLAQARLTADEAEKELQRQQTLFEGGGVTEASLDAARQRRDIANSQRVAAGLEAAATAQTGSDTATAAATLAAAQASLEEAQALLDRTRLRAPGPGRILLRSVEVGQVVRPGDALLTFAGAGDLEVVVNPDEVHLDRLRADQRASVRVEAFRDRALDARVVRIAPQVDPNRGTVEVRLALDDAGDLALRPDMTATVEIILGEKDEALLVPITLVRDVGTASPWVLVARDGVAERVDVRLGLEGDEAVELADGVTVDDALLPPDAAPSPGEPVRTRRVEPALSPAP